MKNYKNIKRCFKAVLILLLINAPFLSAQKDTIPKVNNAGWVSVGARSTISGFSRDGAGVGTGGQFRIQLSNAVNTDWFADYIIVSNDRNVKSEYYHIGWSVMYYPFKEMYYPKRTVQPYIAVGHCFDYNRKTVLETGLTKDRWGSAVQCGLGTHFNLTDRFDITLMAQYMIHLTEELEVHEDPSGFHIHQGSHSHSALEGHLLTTVSLNYKIAKLWKRK